MYFRYLEGKDIYISILLEYRDMICKVVRLCEKDI
jgi:hypothetical protein